MRIIHAHKYYYYRAGAERYLLDLMKQQEEQGHQVIPFCMHYPKNQESIWSDYFVSEVETEQGTHGLWQALEQTGRALWSLEAKRKFAALVDVAKPDVVHVHNIYTHISPSILSVCKKRNIPVVMAVHDYGLASANYSLWDRTRPMDLSRLGLFATARTRFIKGSYLATFVLDGIQKLHNRLGLYEKPIDRFLTNSHFTGDVLQSVGFDPDKIQTLYPFTELPQEHEYQDKGYVLFIGRLENYKGPQVLIEAMRSYPDVPVKIVGSGPYEQELRILARDRNNIEFVGYVSGQAREKILREARVCVVPSLWYEAFGLTAVEAMIRKTPVIVSARGALKEIVEPGVSGEWFEPGDVEDLRDKLRLFIQDPNYAESYAQSAHDRALELSDPAAHGKRLMMEYNQAIANKE